MGRKQTAATVAAAASRRKKAPRGHSAAEETCVEGPPTPAPTPNVPMSPPLPGPPQPSQLAAAFLRAEPTPTTAAAVSARFVWALSLLVGRRVVVETRDGSSYDGVLHSAMPSEDDDSGVGVVLRMATSLHNRVRTPPAPVLVVRARDFVQLTAFSVAAAAPTPSPPPQLSGGFATDAEIGARRCASESCAERELTPWRADDDSAAGGDGVAGLTLEECSQRQRPWDQFAENRRRFGVQTSYSEDLYTTPLDKGSAFYRAHAAAAERTAALIEREAASNSHVAEERGQTPLGADAAASEEERYSAVYVPPHRRALDRRPPPVSVAAAAERRAAPPHSPLSTVVHTASSPPPPLPASSLQQQQQSSPQQQELPTLKLPRSYAEAFRPRSRSDGRAMRRPTLVSSDGSSGGESHPTPPMSPLSMLSEPQPIGGKPKTASLDCIHRRSPVVEFQAPMTPVGGSPRHTAAMQERFRIRKTLLSERFRSSSPSRDAAGNVRSPLLSPFLDDPQRMQALQLEPAAPKVSQSVVRDFQSFQLARSRGSFSRESVMEDLRKFQRDFPHVSGRNSMRASASGNLFPHSATGRKPVVVRVQPQPQPQPSPPVSTQQQPATSPPPTATATAPTATTLNAAVAPKPAEATATSKINPNAPAFKPSFNPNASTFTPKARPATTAAIPPQQQQQQQQPPPPPPPKLRELFFEGMKARMAGHEYPEDVLPIWPGQGGPYNAPTPTPPITPTTPMFDETALAAAAAAIPFPVYAPQPGYFFPPYFPQPYPMPPPMAPVFYAQPQQYRGGPMSPRSAR